MVIDYVVGLPASIPQGLYSNLAGNISTDLRSRISRDFARVPKRSPTKASSKSEALGHVFFKDPKLRTNAPALVTMFSPVADQYAFEVPKKDNYDADGRRMDSRTAETFQEMELSMAMAKTRNSRPEDCYKEAIDLMRVYRKK